MAYPRIVHQGRRTYYEVSPGVFNTDPKATGGYARLESLMALKGER